MSKDRKVNRELHYKNIINKQKSIIKQITKSLGRADKVKHHYEDLEIQNIEELIKQGNDDIRLVDSKSCPDCGKGELELIDLKVRKMFVCNKCSYRVIKK